MPTTLQAEAESLLAGCEFEVESQAVLELVRGSDCSAYDCEFVALAMKLNVHLVTMDKKLLRAFPNRAVGLALEFALPHRQAHKNVTSTRAVS